MNYQKLFDLSDRTVVLTGAAGYLGQPFANAYAAHGANVAVLDINMTGAEDVAENLRKRHSVNAIAVECDISSQDSLDNAAHLVERDFGSIEIFHNNAANQTSGLKDQFAPYEEYLLEDWQRVVSIDLQGAFLSTKVFGSKIVSSGNKGSIILTSSIYGSFGADNRIYEGAEFNGRKICNPAVYSTVKAGSEGLVRWLSTYWGHTGVRVNAIVPGGVEAGQNDEFKQRYSDRVPLGRMAHVDEVVGTAVFLASDASAYITGQSIFVDGGLSAW